MGWLIRHAIAWNPHPATHQDPLGPQHQTVFLLAKHPGHHLNRSTGGPTGSCRTQADHPARHTAACHGNTTRRMGVPRRATPRTGPDHISGDLWTIPHLARQPAYDTLPVAVARRCILLGCRPGGVVLDPFAAAATTGIAALQHSRHYIGSDPNSAYLAIAKRRLNGAAGGGAR